MTSKGEQAKSAYRGRYRPVWRVRPARHHPRYRRPAGQNIAAITYYFGSKDDLYLACAQWIADFIGDNFARRPKRRSTCLPGKRRIAAIRDLILSACHNMILLLTQTIRLT